MTLVPFLQKAAEAVLEKLKTMLRETEKGCEYLVTTTSGPGKTYNSAADHYDHPSASFWDR
jgi:hypothetical protein